MSTHRRDADLQPTQQSTTPVAPASDTTGTDPGDGVFSSLVVTADETGQTTVKIKAVGSQTAAVFEVQDSAGNPVFRVAANGTVHIKTAGSVAADL